MARHNPALIWSPEAIVDLDGIWFYYFQVAGFETAEKIVRDIYEGVTLISDHPLSGRVRDEITAGLRSYPVAPHVIFYRVKNEAPELIRILDGRQDIDTIFSTDRY